MKVGEAYSNSSRNHASDLESIPCFNTRVPENYQQAPRAMQSSHANFVEQAIHLWRKGRSQSVFLDQLKYDALCSIKIAHLGWKNQMSIVTQNLYTSAICTYDYMFSICKQVLSAPRAISMHLLYKGNSCISYYVHKLPVQGYLPYLILYFCTCCKLVLPVERSIRRHWVD